MASAGTLILTGANSYSGGTTVSGGVLQGKTTSLQGNILNNAAVVFDQGTAGTYAGNMSGSGALTKTGAGTLILSGTNSYTRRHDGVGRRAAGHDGEPAGQHRQQRRGGVRPERQRHLRRQHVGHRHA